MLFCVIDQPYTVHVGAGLGLSIAKELVAVGARVLITSRAPVSLTNMETIDGIDVTEDNCGDRIIKCLNGRKVDILVNNAGYFYEPVETLESMNFSEQMKMIDICAVGPLRVAAALFKAKSLAPNAKVIMITSQGGSVSWRFTQNPHGHDYGHHMSKAAANMGSVLLAQELKSAGIPVAILHPGFNKTEMTAKYKDIWEIEGAVDPSVGAKRVCHEIARLDISRTGKFINCEDGLEIPF
jgi:NAD(P)-dependent dehydrogenase (short-subunit alcohol dehydrogenase family)